MKTITIFSVCIIFIFQSCDSSLNSKEETNNNYHSLYGSLKQEEKSDSAFETLNEVVDSSQYIKTNSPKTKILIMPCSNCYTCDTKGYDLNPIIESVLKKKTNLEIIPFSHKNFCKKGCSGLKNHEHAKYLLKVSKADFLISTRIYGKCLPYKLKKDGDWIRPNSGDKSWGYSLRITDSNLSYEKKIIYVKGLEYFESIETHLLRNIDKVTKNVANR